LVAGSSAEYPPFEYVADGKLVGYDVDMAEEITRRMGVKVAWEKIDFKGIVAALTAKRVDVLITALTWTPERAERIAFSASACVACADVPRTAECRCGCTTSNFSPAAMRCRPPIVDVSSRVSAASSGRRACSAARSGEPGA